MSSNLETALDARDKGIVCIPVHAGTKVPAVKWKRMQPLIERYKHGAFGQPSRASADSRVA